MGNGIWEQQFGEARLRLLESNDVRALRSGGHDLIDGVILTSVSNLPFEVSLRCAHCGVVFWFRNAEWSRGGISKWRITSAAASKANLVCRAAPAVDHNHGVERRLKFHS